MAKRFRTEYSNYVEGSMTSGVAYFDTLAEAKADSAEHHHYRIVDTKVNAEILVGGNTPSYEHFGGATPDEVVEEPVAEETPKKTKKSSK